MANQDEQGKRGANPHTMDFDSSSELRSTPTAQGPVTPHSPTDELSLDMFEQMLNQKLTESTPAPAERDMAAIEPSEAIPPELDEEDTLSPYGQTGALSVDEFDEYIRKQLESGGGKLDLGNQLADVAATSRQTGSVQDAPVQVFPMTGEEETESASPEEFEEAIRAQREARATQPDTRPAESHDMLLLQVDAPLPSGDELPATLNVVPPIASDPSDPMVGQVVADRFRLIGLLGKGGMGKVYRAKQVGLGRDVAVKLLHPHLASEQESRSRFQREAQSMSRINHKGVASIYDFGEWHGQFFIAMELLNGLSLNKKIKKEVAVPTEEIVEIMLQVCDALAVAHEAQLVHRDLKPENIVLLHDGQIKLVDFGLAVLKDLSKEERLTVEGMTIGTPHYMSPEQCQGMDVDSRSDIYSVGCILYEMLCGDIPFMGDSLMAIMMQQLFAEAIPPSQRKGGADAHPLLEALAMKALSKDANERPATIQEFAEALRELHTNPNAGKRAGSISVGHATREARASAMGIPHLSGRIVRAPTKFAEVLFLVVENPEHYAESYTMHMWSNGFTVKQVETYEAAKAEIVDTQPAAIVVELASQHESTFAHIEADLQSGGLGGCEIAVIGPEDSFDLMTRALEIGVFDYVPESSARQKLPKSLRRIARKKTRPKKKKTSA